MQGSLIAWIILCVSSLLALTTAPSAMAQQTPEQKYDDVASRAGAPTVVQGLQHGDLFASLLNSTHSAK